MAPGAVLLQMSTVGRTTSWSIRGLMCTSAAYMADRLLIFGACAYFCWKKARMSVHLSTEQNKLLFDHGDVESGPTKPA